MIGPDWQQYFDYLCWAIGTHSAYLIFFNIWLSTENPTDKVSGKVSKRFLWIAGLGSLSLSAWLFFYYFVRVYMLIC